MKKQSKVVICIVTLISIITSITISCFASPGTEKTTSGKTDMTSIDNSVADRNLHDINIGFNIAPYDNYTNNTYHRNEDVTFSYAAHINAEALGKSRDLLALSEEIPVETYYTGVIMGEEIQEAINHTSLSQKGIIIDPSLRNYTNGTISELDLQYHDIIVNREDLRYYDNNPYRMYVNDYPSIMFEINEQTNITDTINWLVNNDVVNVKYTWESYNEYKKQTTTITGNPGINSTTNVTNEYKTTLIERTAQGTDKAYWTYGTKTSKGKNYLVIYFIMPKGVLDNEIFKTKSDNNVSTQDEIEYIGQYVKYKTINVSLKIPNEIPQEFNTFAQNRIIIRSANRTQTQINDIEYRYQTFLENNIINGTSENISYSTNTNETIFFGEKISDFFVNTLGGLFEFEIAPNISIGSILSVMIIFAVFIIILKIFAGG